MESKPDTIKVSALQREEISANRADLSVTVKGSSLVSGDQAMKKAREVSQLVEALTSFGLRPEAIHLQGVHIESSSGMLMKSSSATYRLKVECEKLDQLADVLDIIASQKNTTLEKIEWKYPEELAQERGLEAALAKAKTKAGKVAASLGVKLLGVYDLIENTFDEERPTVMYRMQAAERGMAKAQSEPSLDMDITHTKTITVNVEIWYRVSSFQ
jgi:uncharacterized protein YggE